MVAVFVMGSPLEYAKIHQNTLQHTMYFDVFCVFQWAPHHNTATIRRGENLKEYVSTLLKSQSPFLHLPLFFSVFRVNLFFLDWYPQKPHKFKKKSHSNFPPNRRRARLHTATHS